MVGLFATHDFHFPPTAYDGGPFSFHPTPRAGRAETATGPELSDSALPVRGAKPRIPSLRDDPGDLGEALRVRELVASAWAK